MFAPGSMRLSACCCTGCCGGGEGGLVCCHPVSWGSLGAGEPVADESEAACHWQELAGTLVGTGTGRAWANDVVSKSNATSVTTPTGCLTVTATAYAPVSGDTAQIGFLFAALQVVSDGTDVDVKYSPSEGAGVVSLGTFLGTTHILSLKVCDPYIVYVVDGTPVIVLDIALFPTIVTAVALHAVPVHVGASNTGQLSPVNTSCTVTVAPLLLDENGDPILDESGNYILED